MAETKAKTPRKPRTKVAKPEEPVILNEEELLKDPNMKDPEEVADLAETVEGIPSADEVVNLAEIAKEAENSLEKETPSEEVAALAETEDEEVAEKEDGIAEKEDEISGELASEAPASTELPENVTPFNDYSPKKIAAEICKLNPNLADGQSKWLARVTFNGASHKIFKGSYAKALNAAKNYNILHGMPDADIKKVRN